MVQRESSALGRAPQSLAQIYQQAKGCQRLGRYWEAEQLYRRVLKADDRNFGATYQLGLLCLQQQKFEDAARWFRRALNIDRNVAEAHHHLGLATMELKRFEDAVQHYEAALAIEPGVAETHNNLGHALQTLGRVEAAVAHYQKALAIRPTFSEAHNNIGNALAELDGDEEAIPHYEQAAASSPRDPRPRENLGNALDRLGRAEEAMAQYQNLAALTPNDPAPHNNMGRVFKTLGKMDDAFEAFEKAVAVAPKRGGGYWNLALARRFTAEDRHFAAMQELAREVSSLDIESQIALHFALGKVLADVGDRQQSVHHLRAANALERRRIAYDEAKVLGRLERIRAAFPAELLRERSGFGDSSPVPVFIVGMPRSGTTLIEQVLASHPKVFGAGELQDVARLARTVRGPNGTEWPEAIASLPAERLRELGATYVERVRRFAPQADRITDKMPGNFVHVGLIHLMLPNARIIHSRRDPCDTALSCFSILFARGQEYSYDLGELGRYYRAYEALMEHWRKVLPPSAMLEVQYEDVVADLEGQARRIVAYCGLEWDDACLSFHTTERPVRTASATQVRQPIYRSSVGRRQGYEDLLRPFLEALGPRSAETPS